MLQPRLVQPVDLRDPLDPSPAPARQSHLAGRALDKIAAHMGPAECKGHLALAKASESLVGAIAVADDDRVEEAGLVFCPPAEHREPMSGLAIPFSMWQCAGHGDAAGPGFVR